MLRCFVVREVLAEFGDRHPPPSEHPGDLLLDPIEDLTQRDPERIDRLFDSEDEMTHRLLSRRFDPGGEDREIGSGKEMGRPSHAPALQKRFLLFDGRI